MHRVILYAWWECSADTLGVAGHIQYYIIRSSQVWYICHVQMNCANFITVSCCNLGEANSIKIPYYGISTIYLGIYNTRDVLYMYLAYYNYIVPLL